MKKLLTILILVLVLASCERIFTTSPLSALRRDPSNYSDEQKLTYAEDVLASGDREAMAAAFELLSGSSDPETQMIAVDLAVGAAGVEAAVTSLIADLAAAGDDPDALDAAISDALSGFTEDDFALLASAGTLLESGGASGGASAEQYAFVAVGLVAAAASEAGSVEDLGSLPADSDGQAYLDQAESFLNEATSLLTEEGGSTDLLDGFTDLIPGS